MSCSMIPRKGRVMDDLKTQQKGIQIEEVLQKDSHSLITLQEFFLEGYFTEDLVTTTYMTSCHEVDERDGSVQSEEEVHLREAKMIEKEENEIYAAEEVFAQCANCHGKIIFTDEDLLLGSKPHNRPPFVARVIGIIWLDVIMEDLKTRPLFHVIDSKTSYNLLLGRPWLHENGIVPSTLHQCFKYSDGKQVKKVIADLQPFTETESHFADAKFYLNCDMVNDALPEDNKRMREKGKGHDEIPLEDSRLSRKEGQTPFGLVAEAKVRPNEPAQEKDIAILKSNLTLPLPKLDKVASTKPPLKGFIKSASDSIKEGLLPDERTKGGQQGCAIETPKTGLGYSSQEPVRISAKGKNERRTALHISFEVAEEESQAEPTPRSSMSAFDRLGSPSTSKVASQSKVEKGNTRKKGESEICSLVPSHMKRELAVEVSVVLPAYHVTVETDSGSSSSDDEPDEASHAIEDGGQATVDELKELNLGTTDEPRPIFVSVLLTPAKEKEYLELLTEYKDVLAWMYKEMPELLPQIEAEVNKLEQAEFIREVQFPKWIANIVPVKKKNGQIRVCVNFRDLSRACPKDDFPLPNTELMVDSTIGHKALSFMDSSSGYNQIRMAPEDEELIAFRTPKGIYCYKVMPFGLKNAGATYQRAMQKIFDDILHKIVQCYVDDLVLKMNPLKCAFGVTSRKFLGFIIQHRGIEVDQSKIDAIQRMPELKNLWELRSLQGHLAYIRCFISNLARQYQPFSRLMKKYTNFEWDEACKNAFETQEQSLGALLAQKNEAEKEKALYYLSRKLTGAELKYSPIEKMCLALFFLHSQIEALHASTHTIHLVAKVDPVKYILSRPVISGRLAKWSVAFQEFEIAYVSQKAIKGQALANFLADHPIPADWELLDDFPDEDVLYTEILLPWMMFFDGAACCEESGVGVVFVSPQKHMLPFAFRLNESCSNNVAEYQALIAGLLNGS
uniref:Reverse transcriptase domain-containing protein n=1 Tax=Fagus sylvatica TaxID=28930 RepID=A0A2N9GV74_FAGSY